MDSEIWKNIEGAKGYQVSNLGNVRSIDRYIEREGGGYKGSWKKRLQKGKLLKQAVSGCGYYSVILPKSKGRTVHTLVWDALNTRG